MNTDIPKAGDRDGGFQQQHQSAIFAQAA